MCVKRFKSSPKLSRLDCLSRQFIQRAKAYKTIIRLGTYCQKVLSYNSLKACKGNVFFLPLPLTKTFETLGVKSLSDPELYIIFNGKPTKDRIVRRSLVEVNDIKAAVAKLRDTNWLYMDVEDTAVDLTMKEVIAKLQV